MKILIIFLTAIMTCSCDKTDGNADSKSAENISIDFQIILENSSGDNLLDPSKNGSFSHSEIKLFRDSLLTNEVTDTFIQSSSGIFFLDLSGGGKKELIRENSQIKYGTLYLQLNSTTVDTIYSESIYKGESLLLNKVLYNSKEVYSLGDNRAITVIKE